MANAIQISNPADGGFSHVMGVGDLKVMVIRDRENEWYAQGLEIDYLAQGTSLEEVKSAFEDGLVATIDVHLQLYGHIKKLLKNAPADVWDEFYKHVTSDEYGFTTISHHDLDQGFPATTDRLVASKKQQLPFRRIAYVEQCA